MFTVKEISQISFQIVNFDICTPQKKSGMDFNKIKTCFLEVFEEGECDEEKSVEIYHFVKRIWKDYVREKDNQSTTQL